MTLGLTLFLHLVELMCCTGRFKLFFPQAGHCPLDNTSRGSSFGGFFEEAAGLSGFPGEAGLGESGTTLFLAGFGDDPFFPNPPGGALVAGFDAGVFFCDLHLFTLAKVFLFSINLKS